MSSFVIYRQPRVIGLANEIVSLRNTIETNRIFIEELESKLESSEELDRALHITRHHLTSSTEPSIIDQIEQLKKTIVLPNTQIEQLKNEIRTMPQGDVTKNEIEQLKNEIRTIPRGDVTKNEIEQLKNEIQSGKNLFTKIEELKKEIHSIPHGNTELKKLVQVEELKGELGEIRNVLKTTNKELVKREEIIDIRKLVQEIPKGDATREELEEIKTWVNKISQTIHDEINEMRNAVKATYSNIEKWENGTKNEFLKVKEEVSNKIQNVKNDLHYNMHKNLNEIKYAMDEIPRGDVMETDFYNLEKKVGEIPRGNVMKTDLLLLKSEMIKIPKGDVFKTDFDILKEQITRNFLKLTEDLHTTNTEVKLLKEYLNAEIENIQTGLQSVRIIAVDNAPKTNPMMQKILSMNTQIMEVQQTFMTKITKEVKRLSHICDTEINEKINNLRILETRMKQMDGMVTEQEQFKTRFRSRGNNITKLITKTKELNNRISKLEKRKRI